MKNIVKTFAFGVIASPEMAKQSLFKGLLRRSAPRNDAIVKVLIIKTVALCLVLVLFSFHQIVFAGNQKFDDRYFLYKGEEYNDEGQIKGEGTDHVHILQGESKLIKFKDEIVRTSISDTAIADVVVVSPEQVLVNAKSSGSTTMVVWDKEQKTRMYDITVGLDIPRLNDMLKAIAPNENIKVTARNQTVVLQGEVQRQQTVDDVNEVVKTFSEKVVNLVRLKEARQIMLKVRFAEVNRSATKELGFDFVTGNNKNFKYYSLPNHMITDFEDDKGRLEINAAATEGVLQLSAGKWVLTQLFDNLEKKGLLRTLAEPNLVTVDGKEASFLAGGEYPVPIVTDNGKINILFKEYGVKLNFTPIITEKGLIRLAVKPETSILDLAAGAVKLNGFTIPGLITRRADTTVELSDGQSLVIGGLISNTVTKVNRRVPGLAHIPVLGTLFKSKNFENSETELLVLVTPYFVKPSTIPNPGDPVPVDQMPEMYKREKFPYTDKQGDTIKQYLDHPVSENKILPGNIPQFKKVTSSMRIPVPAANNWPEVPVDESVLVEKEATKSVYSKPSRPPDKNMGLYYATWY